MKNSPFYLSLHGTPAFDIILPANPLAPLEFAADELRRALYAMTGATARLRHAPGRGNVSIYLNDWQAAADDGIAVETLALGGEAYHLETVQDHLHILAGGAEHSVGAEHSGGLRGVLYGVYDLLDGLGCRWYTPEISHIPRRPSLRLPVLQKTVRPAFESRDTFNWECHDALWWVRNRMNGWYTPVPEYMGGHVDYCGFVHTFESLLPPEQYFDQHPEYYSLVGGQRRREQAQLCLTHPDVLYLVTQAVLQRMGEHPQATIFSVSQNDCQGYCECPACQAVAEAEGGQSGPLLRFVNAVAAVTSRQHPDKLIDTLAYQYSLDAPRFVQPHPNVRVRLCSITCCQGHEYGTCDHPESQRFLRALDGWAQRTNQLYIWHYATNFTHYPLPMPDLDELHDNINLYQKYGVHGVFIQGMGEAGGGAELMALRGYLVSKLLWNPRQPVWSLIDEFLPAYYGKAAAGVRRYLDIFHQCLRQDHDLHVSLYDLPTSRLYDDDLRLPADQALAEAESQVGGLQRQRVRLLRAGLDYVRLFRSAGTFQRAGDRYQGQAAPEAAQEFDRLAHLWQRAGQQRIREAEPLPVTLQRLRSRLAAHPVTWLQDETQCIAVVPALGGRLLEWQVGGAEHSGGAEHPGDRRSTQRRQWLAPAQPDSTWSTHPFSGGATEFAILGMYATRGWCEPYRLTWEEGGLCLATELIVDGTADLQFVRYLRLEEGRLHISSLVKNLSRSPISVGWGATWCLALNEPSASNTPAAPNIPATLKVPGSGLSLSCDQLPGGSVTLAPVQLPGTRWQVELAGQVFNQEILVDEPLRLAITYSGQQGMLTLELRSGLRTVQPGGHLQAQQLLWIE